MNNNLDVVLVEEQLNVFNGNWKFQAISLEFYFAWIDCLECDMFKKLPQFLFIAWGRFLNPLLLRPSTIKETGT